MLLWTTEVGSRERVGFIGLGIMGKPMARNLLAAGFPVTVYSRSDGPVEGLVADDAVRADSPASVAASSDVTITMLPDTADVEQVLVEPDGVLEGVSDGALVIDMSSIDPEPTREMAAKFASKGVAMLDAPVSGGEKGAVDAELSIMV
ncbi:MAG: NAD(P)-binding domain-containing protein, partial [Actinobacteria bacterium]|nr:NAD(P)-binding domain-containing protein [Actinomycetota bacterium]